MERSVHGNANLTKLLIEGIKPISGAIRNRPFLATSHMATILSEVFTEIWFQSKRSGVSQFSKADVFTVFKRILVNHSDEEIEKLTLSCIYKALEIGIILDETPGENNFSQKSFL